MALECLLVTCDSTLLAQIKSIINTHAASLDLRQDSASAIELAGRRHWDGLVIDYDDVAGGTETLAKVRNSRSNKETVIVAIGNGSTRGKRAFDLGENFVLRKPIQEARLRTVLNIALDKMECEHRRYFRYGIDLPVRFRNHLGECFTGRMKNVSEGGLAIKLVDPMHLKHVTGVLPVEFDIPSLESRTFQGNA